MSLHGLKLVNPTAATTVVSYTIVMCGFLVSVILINFNNLIVYKSKNDFVLKISKVRKPIHSVSQN